MIYDHLSIINHKFEIKIFPPFLMIVSYDGLLSCFVQSMHCIIQTAIIGPAKISAQFSRESSFECPGCCISSLLKLSVNINSSWVGARWLLLILDMSHYRNIKLDVGALLVGKNETSELTSLATDGHYHFLLECQGATNTNTINQQDQQARQSSQTWAPVSL